MPTVPVGSKQQGGEYSLPYQIIRVHGKSLRKYVVIPLGSPTVGHIYAFYMDLTIYKFIYSYLKTKLKMYNLLYIQKFQGYR